jgi:hypothetical protein
MTDTYSRFSPEPAWAAPPLIGGDWRDLSLAESATLLVRFAALTKNPAERRLFVRYWPTRLRAMRLRCYPGWVFVEVQTAHPDDRVGLCNFLFGPPGSVLVDGTSTAIHWLNGEGFLKLGEDAAAASDYLRFFCSAVHGAEGRFQVLESPEDLRSRMTAQGTVPAQPEFATHIRPLELVRHEGGFEARASVLYGAQLFHAVFGIDAAGTIEMADDIPVASLALTQEEFQSPFRLVQTPGAS